MAQTTFQYRDHDIIQILKISRSPREKLTSAVADEDAEG
jgi:hypothetical protein